MEHLGGLLAVAFRPETAFSTTVENRGILRFAVLRSGEAMAWLRSLRNASHHADHQYKRRSVTAILELTSDLTGEAWSPTDLRHTAAQRLADGGISHAGLSEFMGHSSDRVANVYFDASPPQAKRINDALAISPIYKNVAKIATTRTIDKEMLLGLPVEKQIGGVPHGIPIAGIGGCNLGQNLCMKNPVVACYIPTTSCS